MPHSSGEENKPRQAIVLFSGGLDSTLVIALLQRLGLTVLPIHFSSLFNDRQGERSWQSKRENLAREFGLELRVIPFNAEMLDLVEHPHYGLGRQLNPCLDCHQLMLKKSGEMLNELGADFVATGEVLGQRPMSQHRQALELIARKSGLNDLLVRPLSAQLLAPSRPEQLGWIPREKLLAISGRSRKIQLDLAQQWGLRDFQTPAGGCLLTDAGFCRRLRDLMQAQMLNQENIRWIQAGRYFSLGPRCKLVVARNERECQCLDACQGVGDVLIRPDLVSGPLAVLRGAECEGFIPMAARIVAFYCKGERPVSILVQGASGQAPRVMAAEPLDLQQLHALLLR